MAAKLGTKIINPKLEKTAVFLKWFLISHFFGRICMSWRFVRQHVDAPIELLIFYGDRPVDF